MVDEHNTDACDRADLFEALCEESRDLIAVIDRDYRVLYQNRAVTTLLGYDIEERLGRSALELIHPDDVPAVTAMLESCFLDRQRDGFLEYRCRSKDGIWRIFEGRGGVSSGLGAPLGLIHCRDITDRKQLERRVQHALQFEIAGRATAALAHDINNLLTAVICHIETLADAPPGDARASVDQALKACERMSGFARRLVRPRSESLPHGCHIDAALADLAALMRPMLGKDIVLHFALGADEAIVVLDHASLEQVVMNLIVNARDAMPAGGLLTITTRRAPDGHLMLAIADTGSGMPPQIRERIFEPFFSTKGERGSGLGLAIVADIVARVDGTIDVESAVGLGTTFRIGLPCLDASAHER